LLHRRRETSARPDIGTDRLRSEGRCGASDAEDLSFAGEHKEPMEESSHLIAATVTLPEIGGGGVLISGPFVGNRSSLYSLGWKGMHGAR